MVTVKGSFDFKSNVLIRDSSFSYSKEEIPAYWNMNELFVAMVDVTLRCQI